MRSLSPELFDNLIEMYRENDDESVSDILESIAYDMESEGIECPELDELSKNIMNNHGLNIHLCYLTSVRSSGDFTPDEAYYWEIFNAVQYTPAAKVLEQHINNKRCVILG